jgi:hypothetical protein
MPIFVSVSMVRIQKKVEDSCVGCIITKYIITDAYSPYSVYSFIFSFLKP